MSACPTCGRKESNPAVRVFLWIAGISAACLVALPLFVIFCLVVIGAVGSSASESFAEVTRELDAGKYESVESVGTPGPTKDSTRPQ